MSATAVRERPILFSGPMVKALLAGSKTQTRRLVASMAHFGSAPRRFWDHADPARAWVDGKGSRYQYLHVPAHEVKGCEECGKYWWQGTAHRLWCDVAPAGTMDGYPSRLWVRETWSSSALGVYPCPSAWYRADFGTYDDPSAAEHDRGCNGNRGDCFACVREREGRFRWRPSIHMPRRHSRLTLEITDVRVQRLQEISEDDAKAEGMTTDRRPGKVNGELVTLYPITHKQAFVWTWDAINGKRATWASNPWVWRLSFRRIE